MPNRKIMFYQSALKESVLPSCLRCEVTALFLIKQTDIIYERISYGYIQKGRAPEEARSCCFVNK